ncbi:MAG: hemolysin family protein [Chloroflexi bacterium]|nr:hemolysin family protein [Chloroflexota bacterium]
MSPATGLFVVLLLVAANGFFVATEFALVSSRPTRIDQLAAAGNRAARIVQSAKANPTRFISGTQLGVTVASLLLGWIGENTFAQLIQPLLDTVFLLLGQPVSDPGEISTPAHAFASVLALAMITFFHITLGEQVPKILALQRAESIILFAVQPVSALAWVFRPFISLLYLFTNLVLKTIGLEYHGEEHAVHSPEELQLLVSQSARAGLMSAPERELIERAFAFPDQTAGEVMVPRTEIIAMPIESTVQDALRIAQRHRHTRFPVYEKTIDNVIGILSAKDLLSVAGRRGPRTPLADGGLRRLIRPPVIVPQGAVVIEVLARMKAARQPMAVVLDEFGGTAGIVTLKDLVSRLLGSVGDEYAPATHEVRRLADGTIVADGLALVEDVNAQLGTHFDATEVDSLGGLVFSRLGRRPRVGDEVDIGANYRARIDRLDGLRVARVRLLPPRGQTISGDEPTPSKDSQNSANGALPKEDR